jgi:hypothetical protein
MIGVIHRDADLEKRLLFWLESVDPDMVTLEFSSYGLAFRQSHGAELRKRLIETVDELVTEGCTIDSRSFGELLAYIALPSEFMTASAFAESRGIPLHLVDMDSPSQSHLSLMEELLAKDNLIKLLCTQASGKDRLEPAAARLFFEKGVSLFPYDDEMAARDRHMSDRIRELIDSSHGAACFLHVCGWQHLSDPYGFYAPFNPQKAFIYDKALRV